MDTSYFPLSIGSKIRNLLQKKQSINVIGSVSRIATCNLVLEKYAEAQSQLIICATDAEVESIRNDLLFFSHEAEIQVLPGYDVSPYSTLYPQPHISANRMRWLASAINTERPVILLSTLPNLLQNTLPRSVFESHLYTLKATQELDEDFFELLDLAGYNAVETVESPGEFARRGGIVDIFSTGHTCPVRIELFGDEIETIKEFEVESQISTRSIESFRICPASEVVFSEIPLEKTLKEIREVATEDHDEELQFLVRSLSQETKFPGIEFFLPFFYPQMDAPIHWLPPSLTIWWQDKLECERTTEDLFAELKEEQRNQKSKILRPEVDQLYCLRDQIRLAQKQVILQKIHMGTAEESEPDIEWKLSQLNELKLYDKKSPDWPKQLKALFSKWKHNKIVVTTRNTNQNQRIQFLLEKAEIDFGHTEITKELKNLSDSHQVLLVEQTLSESQILHDENLVFIREQDLLGKKAPARQQSSQDRFQKEAEKLSFGDLKSGDYVVHSEHGIGIYEGLKVIAYDGVDCEFLQLKYKDNDKLYLPVYRLMHLRKYSGGAAQHVLDKLGSGSFEKTKIKVKSKVQDIASELLQLYAKRQEITRPPYPVHREDFFRFENAFPYDETEDQVKAIVEIDKDLSENTPMDRLVCGDVGFGKTEVAMCAAFRVAHSGKQVAVLVPTTVLCFQHFETFKKRFEGWPLEIHTLNRFVGRKEQKETLQKNTEGKVDILIGTHRLLSQDVKFQDLGLLILDEEQKFGVKHKEKIRQLRTEVDTLAMSATPIPRTLNLSFVGIRDMSLITTPPVDRLPTRTFVCQFEPETIRKAVLAEVKRGGQIYFIHNRVQSIYGVTDELRQILPEVRIRVGHGQMKEHELEETMTAFFKHEFDMLVCTTIVESGMDVTSANTMFIDQAQNYGLSQLYQLRGRVGRSKQRAYCYLLVPHKQKIDKEAQERLRVIQENTALGSGIRVAHYDLELRGAGDILGQSQSGHINAVGYELYMELLNQAVENLKGNEESLKNIEPNVELRIPALIPDAYIKDIRTRLYYYKSMHDIETATDVDKFEDELRDQFGKPPEQVINLLGIMLIKAYCRNLGVQELKAGPKFVSLTMVPTTPLTTDQILKLAGMSNKKYSISPDSRLKIRINDLTWPRVLEELEYLLSLVG